MDNTKATIERLEAEIAELPKGYISRKNINGKIRQYHQWTEEGKKKSKYLDDDTTIVMAGKIAERKELQKKLKEAKALSSTGKAKEKNQPEFRLNILTGDVLRSFVSKATRLKSRPCLKQL